jgi:FAS-associated factor 2
MFLNSSTVQVVYDYVDTLMCFDVLSYSLFSSFPRVVYGSGSRDMTLTAAGFYPRVSLFVQVDDDH